MRSGCAHGTCVHPHDCLCGPGTDNPDWRGVLCDEPICEWVWNFLNDSKTIFISIMIHIYMLINIISSFSPPCVTEHGECQAGVSILTKNSKW